MQDLTREMQKGKWETRGDDSRRRFPVIRLTEILVSISSSGWTALSGAPTHRNKFDLSQEIAIGDVRGVCLRKHGAYVCLRGKGTMSGASLKILLIRLPKRFSSLGRRLSLLDKDLPISKPTDEGRTRSRSEEELTGLRA